MNAIEQLISHACHIEATLGYVFRDRTLMALAFVHRSYVNEHREITEHNERLEFLGDSILGLLISEYLYRHLPHTPEGELSCLRAKLVEAASCIAYIQKLHLEPFLLLGKGEKMNDGRGRDSILADLFEAIIAAVYLDGGIEAARSFLLNNFSSEIEATIKLPFKNSKALLQDYCQKKYQKVPFYKVLSESGPDHNKNFEIAVIINNEELGRGMGSSKKEAQQAAATDAIMRGFSTPTTAMY